MAGFHLFVEHLSPCKALAAEGIDSGMRLLSIGQSVKKTALKLFGRRSTISLRFSIFMHESNTYVMSQVGDGIGAVS